MKLKTLLVALIFAFLFSTTFATRFNTLVAANPIPVPVIWMPEEYINATISPIDGVLWARVNGTYPFVNWGYENVTMCYPVPPDAYNISVKMNETSLDWSYSDKNYSTVIGDFPMINWTIWSVPAYFTIKTYYEHPVPLTGGNYTFLYAMGTGRYLEALTKETTAYITVRVSKDVAYREEDINVYRIGYNATTGEWIWKPANYTITQEYTTWKVTLKAISEMLTPLEEDLLLTIRALTDLVLETDKNVYDLGEEVRITFTNYSNETVSFLHWIPFGIHGPTGLVYPALTLPAVTQVPPMSSLNWKWDQINAFNASLVPPGMYNVSLKVYDEACENMIADLQTQFKIASIGDVNCDGIVDIVDVVICALAFGSKPGDPNWNPVADLNNDGIIDIVDLVIIGINFGKRL